MICTPPKAFGTPANYIYFDLIVSYLIILTTKFVKLPILWSQILPCRPRKQILLNFFLGLSWRCHHAPAKASTPSLACRKHEKTGTILRLPVQIPHPYQMPHHMEDLELQIPYSLEKT
jgi:hypothetical protein